MTAGKHLEIELAQNKVGVWQWKGTLSVEFGAYGVPETFVIDKNKKIIRKFIGPINNDILEEIKLIIK